jgi:two-component system, chemotaxis family, CheB/CheR fusion protein
VNRSQGRLLATGIGASAGGLEALKQMFPHLPSQKDIAYVVVQHLDPKHQSMLAALLASSMSMKAMPFTAP